MGSRMAQRLLAAGHSVIGYNRTKSKAQGLLDAGMQWGESPRSVAMAAEIIFSMVTNTEALQAITSGPNGILAGLAPGKIYIDMSTVSPAASREIARQVEAKGAQMLDAPVSGSVITLEEGKLSIMVGGEPSDVRTRAADPASHRSQGDSRRRQRPCRFDEDRNQLEPRRANASL